MTKYQRSGSKLQNPQYYVQVHSQNRYKALAVNLHYPHFVILDFFQDNGRRQCVILKQIQDDDDLGFWHYALATKPAENRASSQSFHSNPYRIFLCCWPCPAQLSGRLPMSGTVFAKTLLHCKIQNYPAFASSAFAVAAEPIELSINPLRIINQKRIIPGSAANAVMT
jgi:hypothetical protein